MTHSKSLEYPSFTKLSPHTNLNLAPSNWLERGVGIRPNIYFNEESYLNLINLSGFSFPSFNLANKHLEELGEIDVVSDAEVYLIFYKLYLLMIFIFTKL